MSRGQGHLIKRRRGGVTRYYADLRSYDDVGGKVEALRAGPDELATTDPAIAQVLLAHRLEELTAGRQGRVIHGIANRTTLQAYVSEHLLAKEAEVSRSGERLTTAWLSLVEQQLERAIEFFGADRDLRTIKVEDVTKWLLALGQRGLSGGTIRHHLNTLSNLFRRALAEEYAERNPVALLREKPRAQDVEAEWLEVPDAALLLESARTYRPIAHGGPAPFPFAYELIATFLLTGGREAEVLGLEVADVSLDRGIVTFRPNDWRRLKTKRSRRSVPLWPQLRAVLEQYLAMRPPSRLLFPSYRTGEEAMVTDFHKILDAVAVRAGWAAAEIRSKRFRHTYITARLQTLDNGEPISSWTVAREAGHSSPNMIEQRYGHLGKLRHRSDVVEYRVEQYADKLGERLTALRAGGFVTTIDTTDGDSQPSSVSRSAATPRA